MSKIFLNKRELDKLFTITGQFPDDYIYELISESHNGIGSTLDIKVHDIKYNNILGDLIINITDELNW